MIDGLAIASAGFAGNDLTNTLTGVLNVSKQPAAEIISAK